MYVMSETIMFYFLARREFKTFFIPMLKLIFNGLLIFMKEMSTHAYITTDKSIISNIVDSFRTIFILIDYQLLIIAI